VITRRKLLTATLYALFIGGTAMSAEWSERYRAQLRKEAERRGRIRVRRRAALAEQRAALAEQNAEQRAWLKAFSSRGGHDSEKDANGRYKDGP
jgi:hypothetical protein